MSRNLGLEAFGVDSHSPASTSESWLTAERAHSTEGAGSISSASYVPESPTSQYLVRLRKSRRISSSMLRQRSWLSLSDDEGGEESHSLNLFGSGSSFPRSGEISSSEQVFIPDVLPKLERMKHENRKLRSASTQAAPHGVVPEENAWRPVLDEDHVLEPLDMKPSGEGSAEFNEPAAFLIQYGMKGAVLERKIHRELEGGDEKAPSAVREELPTSSGTSKLNSAMFLARLAKVKERIEQMEVQRAEGRLLLSSSATPVISSEDLGETLESLKTSFKSSAQRPDRIIRNKMSVSFEKEARFVLVWDDNFKYWVVAAA